MRHDSKVYQSGLTLGLTVAEVLILILFIFLLIFNAYDSEKEKELVILQDELKIISVENETLINNLPKDIKTLTKENIVLQQSVERFEDQLSGITEEKETQIQKIKTLTQEKKQLQQDINEVSDTLAEVEEQNEKLISRENEQNNSQKGKNLKKGIDPPCWYKVTKKRGRRHERSYYLFNIAIYDYYIEVEVPDPPLGKAINEQGQTARTTYVEEYRNLSPDALQPKKYYSLQNFQNTMNPIFLMGKSKKIRDYRCVFYARIWDFTGPKSKTRWKQAEDAVKSSFYIKREDKNSKWHKLSRSNY